MPLPTCFSELNCHCSTLNSFEPAFPCVASISGQNETTKIVAYLDANNRIDRNVPGNRLYEFGTEIRLESIHPGFGIGQLFRKCFDSLWIPKHEQMELLCQPNEKRILSKKTCDAYKAASPLGMDDSHKYTHPTPNHFRDEKILYHGNLIMRTHEIGENNILFAYDTCRDELAWHLPIEGYSPIYDINTLGLTILSRDSRDLHIFDPDSGEQRFSIPLPAVHEDAHLNLAITPTGFCYYRTLTPTEEGYREAVFGAQIANGAWQQSFRVNSFSTINSYSLRSFSLQGEFAVLNHIDQSRERGVTILSQNGSIQTFNDCIDVFIKNGKVYSVSSEGVLTIQEYEGSTVLKLKGPQYSVPLAEATRYSNKIHDIQDDGMGNIEIAFKGHFGGDPEIVRVKI